MPDKEFDRLFKDKFNDAEIEPSANFWANIDHELAPKRKRKLPLLWMAAATVTLAISAMLMFQKKEVIELRGTEAIAQNMPTVAPEAIAAADELPTSVQTVGVAHASAESTGKMQFQQASTPVKDLVASAQKSEIDLQPTTSNDRLPIKTMEAKPLDIVAIKDPVVTEAAVVYANVPQIDREEDVIANNSSEKRGIRNVGDLVNYVVDKVDKRDKKLVKFNTDDDDNSSIVGINIGFLRFNKKNKN